MSNECILYNNIVFLKNVTTEKEKKVKKKREKENTLDEIAKVW